ncbi:hypothetical protein BSKO_10724 [Bryopsis sp. KO-2023]|nr:hypothetical protein BSKO_10724 [Bryopsis sp. KO-2023]
MPMKSKHNLSDFGNFRDDERAASLSESDGSQSTIQSISASETPPQSPRTTITPDSSDHDSCSDDSSAVEEDISLDNSDDDLSFAGLTECEDGLPLLFRGARISRDGLQSEVGSLTDISTAISDDDSQSSSIWEVVGSRESAESLNKVQVLPSDPTSAALTISQSWEPRKRAGEGNCDYVQSHAGRRRSDSSLSSQEATSQENSTNQANSTKLSQDAKVAQGRNNSGLKLPLPPDPLRSIPVTPPTVLGTRAPISHRAGSQEKYPAKPPRFTKKQGPVRPSNAPHDRKSENSKRLCSAKKTIRKDQTSQGETSGSSSSQKAYAISKAATALAALRLGPDQPKVTVSMDKKQRPYPHLLPSPVPNMPATICFKGTPEEKQAAGLHPFTKRKVFVRFNGIANTPVRLAFMKAGVRHQRVNHLPGTWELGRKDRLYRNISRLRRAKGLEFDITPQFFILPKDRSELKLDASRHPSRLYIRKPVASSRGRGVRMVQKPSNIPKRKICLVQRYIHNPLTIHGYKVDVRLYVGVTSLDPLRVYLFEDGLVRFATEVYTRDKATLSRRCMHLTNYSVNKRQDNFVKNMDAEDDGVGSKWSLKALRRFLETNRGVDWRKIQLQFHDIVAKTMISVESKMNNQVHMRLPNGATCFEVLGFDILLDDNYKAWLIEVNAFPDLGASSPLDLKIKFGLIEDMLNMIGIVPCDVGAIRRKARLGRQKKLHIGPENSKKIKGPKTTKEAFGMHFEGRSLGDMPETIKQSEAEIHRLGGWEPVLPCRSDPRRYQRLFESLRYNNIVLCRYIGYKMGMDLTLNDFVGEK